MNGLGEDAGEVAGYVDPSAAREHLKTLRDARLGTTHIARRANLSRWTVNAVEADTTTKIYRTTEEAILAVQIPDVSELPPSAQIPALGTVRRLRALVADGHTRTALARELGTESGQKPMRRMLGLTSHTTICVLHHRRVLELFERRRHQPGRSVRARNDAITLGWPPSAAWAGLDIDDPAAEPLQLPGPSPSARPAPAQPSVRAPARVPRVCGACREAPGTYARRMCENCYEKARYRAHVLGTWNGLVDAEPAKERRGQLYAAGLKPTQITQIATPKIGLRAVTGLDSRRRIRRRTHDAIFSVRLPDHLADLLPDNAKIPILGAARRMQALVAAGHPQQYLACELGEDVSCLRTLLAHPTPNTGRGQTITVARFRRVDRLYAQLHALTGPCAEAKELGRRNGWALPCQWIAFLIDNPQAHPLALEQHRGTAAFRDAS